MLSLETALGIMDWQNKHGGHYTRPAGHALKLLGEAIELCVACGANSSEIYAKACEEINKAWKKGEFSPHGQPNEKVVREEIADVTVLLTVLAAYNNTDLNGPVLEKLPVLNSRAWSVTSDGVLVRPKEESQ